MDSESREAPILKRTIVYPVEGVDAVEARFDLPHAVGDDPLLGMDLDYPSGAVRGARHPAVVLVSGYPDPGYQTVFGCKFKEMGWTTSWARLAAASGIAAIAFSNRELRATPDPCCDISGRTPLRSESTRTASACWASSGSVPLALSLSMTEEGKWLKCAVLSYVYTLDLDGSTGVADAARKWKFVDPAAGASVDDLPPQLPLFLARAGRDEMPRLNETLDRFVLAALSRNLPLTCANHAEAPHAFDLFHDSETSREMIRQIIAFTRFHLVAAG